MENLGSKFSLPDDLEESFDDPPPSGPRYFKAGKLRNTAEENPTATSDSVKVAEQNVQIPKASTSGSNTNQECTTRGPATRFLSDFEHLKESKFYDKSVESASAESNQVKSRNFSALLVNPRQRGNPLLKHIRNVPWEFTEVEPDYILGKSSCALFLSLRYHNLFPNYIHDRLKALGKSYQLRVLLVQVDVAEPNAPLKDLSVISILAECTLMVCWSAEEAGSYLETYKMFENKSADLIKEKQDSDSYSQLIDCLTTIRSINKTDAMVLLTTFKTLKGIVNASVEELTQCPGLGPLKAKRLYDALRKPLMNTPRS